MYILTAVQKLYMYVVSLVAVDWWDIAYSQHFIIGKNSQDLILHEWGLNSLTSAIGGSIVTQGCSIKEFN